MGVFGVLRKAATRLGARSSTKQAAAIGAGGGYLGGTVVDDVPGLEVLDPTSDGAGDVAGIPLPWLVIILVSAYTLGQLFNINVGSS